jgi:hypothetical protein
VLGHIGGQVEAKRCESVHSMLFFPLPAGDELFTGGASGQILQGCSELSKAGTRIVMKPISERSHEERLAAAYGSVV